MAQSTNTRDGDLLIIPGTYVPTTVISNPSGLGLTGVLCLIGEAEQGPHWSELSDVSAAGYRPDQINLATAQYGSGNLIDAFRGVITANADQRIGGQANLIYLIKTNQGSKALSSILRSGFGSYAELQAKLAGNPGNQISFKNLTAQAESAPSISSIGAYIHPSTTSTLKIRINGGAENSISLGALGTDTPTSIATSISAILGLLAQGGVTRGILGGSPTGTIAASVSSGNLIVTRSVAWAVTPSIGDIALISSGSSIGGNNSGSYRVSAATSTNVTLVPVNITGALTAVPATSVSAGDIEAYSAISIKNVTGSDRGILASVTGNITSSNFTSSSVKVSLDSGVTFTSTAQVGELVYVPTNFANVLAGWYQISASNNIGTGTLTLSRLSNGSLSGPSASVAVTPTLMTAYKADIDGRGKSLEIIADSNTATILKNNTTATSGGSGIPELNTLVASSEERTAQTVLSKPSALNPITETYVSGGDLVLLISYSGTTCTMTISDTVLTTSASVSGDNLSINLSDYSTMQDLINFINSKQNYSAQIGNSRFNSLSPVKLDNGSSIGIASTLGTKTGRIKKDADSWYQNVIQSGMVEIPTYSNSGLPDNESSSTFLSGGAKGGTTAAATAAAIDACELLNANFIVPLFDRNADEDIADGLTESSSTYDVDAINAYTKAHCISMSTVKARKNRMCFVAVQRSYEDSKQAARDLSHPRVVLAWARINDATAEATTKTFPCWYESCKTAGMTAAAGYKGLVKKFVGVSGVTYPEGFDPRRRGDLEDGLLSGLTIIEPVASGGFRYVSDQTTYNVDNNFVYNSIQAVYGADVIALTLIQDGDRVLVGQPVSQASAAVAKGFIQTEMANLLRLNWIARSDDAPLGYKNLTVNLNGGVIEINVEVKLNGLVYFVVINLALSEVQQSV